MKLNVLHIAYNLDDMSAATKIALAQDETHNIFFFLGRISKSEFINKRQVYKNISSFLGISLHIIDKLIFLIAGIYKGEIFSFGSFTLLQNYLVRKIIKDNKIDLVHVHWGGYGFFPLKAMLNIRKPIIITAHDYYYFTGGCHVPMGCTQIEHNCAKCPISRNWLGKVIVRKRKQKNSILLKKINPTVTAPSSYANNKISQSCRYLNIITIGNTIDEKFENCLDSSSITFDRKFNKNIPTLITVGINRTKRQNKGEDILKRILLKLNLNNIEYNYISIGKYQDYKGIKNRVHYDSILQHELINLYMKSDLCLIPSRYETFSMVTLESILCGTPVIAFDNSGPTDIIIDNKTGFLVDSFDEDLFFNKIKDNLDYKINNYIELKKSSSETAFKFSASNIKSKFDRIYFKLHLT